MFLIIYHIYSTVGVGVGVEVRGQCEGSVLSFHHVEIEIRLAESLGLQFVIQITILLSLVETLLGGYKCVSVLLFCCSKGSFSA